MKTNKWSLLNEDTGEMKDLDSICLSKNSRQKVSKIIIDDMLSKAQSLEEIDIKMLISYLKSNKELNEYYQIKLKGAYRDEEFERHMIQDFTVYGYVSLVIMLAHNFSGILKKNRQTNIKSWTELWECIGCTKSTTRRRVRKFLTENELIREDVLITKKGDVRTFILNPFLFRKAAYTSQVALMKFEDYVKVNENISHEACVLMEALGLFDRHHNTSFTMIEDKEE